MFPAPTLLCITLALITASSAELSLKLYETDTSRYVTCTNTDVILSCVFTVRSGAPRADVIADKVPGQKYTQKSCFYDLPVGLVGDYDVVCLTTARDKADRFAIGDIVPKSEQTQLRVNLRGPTTATLSSATASVKPPTPTPAPSTPAISQQQVLEDGICNYVCTPVQTGASQNCPTIRVAVP